MNTDEHVEIKDPKVVEAVGKIASAFRDLVEAHFGDMDQFAQTDLGRDLARGYASLTMGLIYPDFHLMFKMRVRDNPPVELLEVTIPPPVALRGN